MHIRNRTVALCYRLVCVALIGVALYLNSGLPEGRLSPVMLSYYTIQSALWAFALMGALAVRTARDRRTEGAHGGSAAGSVVTGAVTVAVTITLLVYHFLLVPQLYTMGASYRPFTPRDLAIHYATPLSIILDWLLFQPKGRHRWRDAIVWLGMPLAYFVFALVRAEIGGPLGMDGSRYPYFFLDLDVLGWGGLLRNVAGLSVCFTLLGTLYVALDRVLGRLRPRADG
ncbi:MAG: Pr6Pr family membrane protein [Chloroflexi bacterium]|nr:Pr6Pr family membrane protein [Chloroflexota bacterium]